MRCSCGAGIVVAAIVWVLATIAILRGRRRRGAAPAQTRGNPRVELPVDGHPARHGARPVRADGPDAGQRGRERPPAGVDLHVTAFRWQWQADYTDAGVRIVGTTGQPLEVVLPVGRTVHVTLDSLDVNHSFYVPAFLFKRDAIPGSPTTFDLRVDGARASIPGRARSSAASATTQMPFTIRGVDQTSFDAWLAAHRAASASPAP